VRTLMLLYGVLLVAGCASGGSEGALVGLYEVDDSRIIDGTLTISQIKESILQGAKSVGWEAKDQGNDRILAIFHIRTHTIYINIDYSESLYSTRYRSSIGMKMACSRWENKKFKFKVSGIENCPYDAAPFTIHANYKIWIDRLNAAIQTSLAIEKQNQTL
jgi:hypothetical protein